MVTWTPSSESDIQLAIDEGTLTESAYFEVKRSTGEADGERKETARDLASFALSGGAILIGVAEDKAARTFSLAPQPLSGLGERLEQIARNRINPPLFTRSREIPSQLTPRRATW
jgi:hypothetical protein